MNIIDFTHTPKQAFANGFIKGLIAPVLIFGKFQAPELRKVKQIPLPTVAKETSFEHDWEMIGNDFKKVIASYEQENSR